jgi:cellulose synthase/poly-beta-1,6-N-acetylglucosamine synthase-like glycosyltransferase
MSYLFIVGITLGIARFLAIDILALIQNRRMRRRKYPVDYKPGMSIIVPAYNEAKVIDKTVDALLASTYENFEIIIVDDGSSDDTYERAMELYGGNPRVRTFKKQNGGKAEALNFGIEHSASEIIMVMDADTVMLSDAAEKLARHFVDPRVGAVAGNAKVGNRLNLLTNWQALEYITGQNLDRRAFALLNCITVVPGAIGAWRRELVVQMGGFTSQTLAEDADLTLTILRNGYRIEYEDEAIALTEAPDTVKAFLKQRFRWMFGTMQAAWKHLGVLMKPKYGSLGIVAIPNILIFQIFFPLISPLMDLAALISVGQIAWERYQHPLHPAPDELTHLLVFYLLFLAFDFLTAFSAFLLEKKEDWSLITWLFFQRFFYRQLMYYVAVKSVMTAVRGQIVGWGKLERKATVNVNIGSREAPK